MLCHGELNRSENMMSRQVLDLETQQQTLPCSGSVGLVSAASASLRHYTAL